jgi:hypothetical protein
MAGGGISKTLPISQPSRVGYQLRFKFPDPNRLFAVGFLILDSRKTLSRWERVRVRKTHE